MARQDSHEVKETLRRIEDHPNVAGVIIADGNGSPIYTTFEKEETAYYIQQCTTLLWIARNATREADPTDELQFFRIRTKKYEIMLAPEKEYLLFVMQNIAKANATKW